MRNNRCVISGLSLAFALALAGCLDGTGNGTGARPDSARAGQAVERDVEAPEVFSKRDAALWDGRPSLGGVWVAHPDARTPERVIIRNTESGRETIGALFRRERMNPGPIFQVSADAAAAVGMLAGAPTGIEVIALRTEEIAPAPSESPEQASESVPSEATAAAVAAAAPPVPAQSAPAQPAAQSVSAVASAAPSAEAPADASTGLIALPEPDAPAPRGGFFSRLFGRSTAPDASSADGGIETQVLPDTNAPLDATASAAPQTSGADAPLRMPTPIGTQSAPAVPAPAAVSNVAKPFIQLGIFSVEANANRARTLAQNAGLSARVVKGKTQGNDFWRVTVGPAASAAEQRDLLARVKGLGFTDAYTVRR